MALGGAHFTAHRLPARREISYNAKVTCHSLLIGTAGRLLVAAAGLLKGDREERWAATAASVRSCTEAALGAIGCSHLVPSSKVAGKGEAAGCGRMGVRVFGDGRQQNHKHWPGRKAGVWRGRTLC